MSNSDSSVVMALSELARMEAGRIEDERAAEQAREVERVRARERAEADAEADRNRRAAAAEHGARVAEAEARLRLDADREQSRRIEQMRAELARVESERAALRANLEARVAAPGEAPRVRGWAMAFGLSSLVAASLAALLVMNAREPRTVLVAPPPLAAVPAPVSAPAVEVVVATPPAVAAPAAVEVETPRARPAHGRHRPTTTVTSPPGDDLGLGTDESDEVLSDEFLRHSERRAPR